LDFFPFFPFLFSFPSSFLFSLFSSSSFLLSSHVQYSTQAAKRIQERGRTELPPPTGPHGPLAATRVPPRRRCPSPLPPLFQSLLLKLNPIAVLRSRNPNHRRKNHVKTRSVASAIYRRSFAIVSCQSCDFFSELEVNPTSMVSSPYRTLTPRLYGSEIGGL
jgi:hypothetical protein